jgi:hypothetical protein
VEDWIGAISLCKVMLDYKHFSFNEQGELFEPMKVGA